MKRMIVVMLLCMSVLITGCRSKDAKNMDALIMAIGDVDASSGPVLAYVREQYDLLTDEDKENLRKYDVMLAAEAAYVDALIDSIGEVTAESADVIAAAETAFADLDQEAQKLVNGVRKLQDARPELEDKILIHNLAGFWVNEVLGSTEVQIGRGLVRSYGLDETNCNPVNLDKTQFELLEDGILIFGGFIEGTWHLSENKDALILEADGRTCTLEIQEEGGFIKLTGTLFDNEPFGYVKEEDYVSAFHEKYAVVELSRENIETYFADPVSIGKVETSQGKNHNAYWYESKVYEDGLVYIGSSCVIPVEYNHGGKISILWLEFPVLSTTNLKVKDIHIKTDTRISGEVFYVKAPYVAKNYINEDGYRVLELTNGTSMVFDGYDDLINTFWQRSDMTYEDYIY